MDDLIEWLQPLKVKMLSIMPNWRPSCFIIDDAPQYGHYGEYEFYFISFFIIMLNEDQKFSLSKVFFIPKKLTLYLYI
jgi:hypothetical protein